MLFPMLICVYIILASRRQQRVRTGGRVPVFPQRTGVQRGLQRVQAGKKGDGAMVSTLFC